MPSETARVSRALTRVVEKVVKKITLDIVANLQAAASEGGTPVDTGWARANWIPSISTPTVAPAGSRQAVSIGPSAVGAATVAATYKLRDGRVYIVNAVPYIKKLNQGSSRKAPAAFVQRAIAKAIRVDLLRQASFVQRTRGA